MLISLLHAYKDKQSACELHAGLRINYANHVHGWAHELCNFIIIMQIIWAVAPPMMSDKSKCNQHGPLEKPV